MKKIGLVILAIISASFVFAQEDTYNTENRRAQLSSDTMTVDFLVIPASKRLYNSFFDRQMIETNNLDFNTLRDTTLSTLAFQVATAFNDSLPSGVIPESLSKFEEDMNFVYESIQYKYELVPERKKEETTLNKWKKKLPKKKPQEAPRKGTYMENGQIVSNPESDPQYTNITVLNPDFLFVLNQKYKASTFIFINQYEMVIPTHVDQISLQSDNYARILKVHYSIVNVEGKVIHSGLVTQSSSSYDDKLDYLFETSFLQIGHQIRMNLAETK
ncbi:MAG: hypothetical protein ACPGD5_06360 [Salibacteraceae bacterium]